jgi:putative ABC transport system permease protein
LVGRTILLEGQKFTVVGVMPAGFQFLSQETALWVPAAFSPRELANRRAHYLTVMARMKAGVTLQQAQADIATITQRIVRDHPDEARNLGSVVLPLREQLAGEVRRPLLVLLAAVGCVLLIACANLANLLLARAAARHREIAVRTALGAGRGRLVRQLLTESMLLAGLGGAVGLLLANWSFAFLKQLVPEGMALSAGLRLNPQVLGYTLLLALLTGVIFGLAPALQAARVDLHEALKQSGGRSGLGAGQGRLRGALVVAEVALALMLLVAAGLMMQTFFRLRNLDAGFRVENVLTAQTILPRGKYRELSPRSAFYQQVLERVSTLPGVTAAGFTTALPLVWKGGTNGFSVEGREQGTNQDALYRQISPDYFRAVSIPLRAGRYFDQRDGPDSLPVAIINEAMARQFWPQENALGKRFKLGAPGSERPWLTIVGIVGDIKTMGLEAPVKAEMFFPYQQAADFWSAPRDLAIQASVDPLSLAAAVRREIWEVDRDQPVSNVGLLDEILAGETAPRRLQMWLFAAFAALALLLASLGMYGVLAYAVTQRTPEIGVRIALGARPRDVLQLIVRDGMRLALMGVALGLAGAFALTRVMASLLCGVSATDPATFIGVSLLLAAVSIVASLMPARRATKVDPMVALRYE